MRLEWSEAALKDREEVFDYIAADRPQAAIEMDLRIRDQCRTLLQFPATGRSGRVRGTRELVIQHSPYIAAYRVKEDAVQVLRILHGGRRWPGKFTEKKGSR